MEEEEYQGDTWILRFARLVYKWKEIGRVQAQKKVNKSFEQKKETVKRTTQEAKSEGKEREAEEKEKITKLQLAELKEELEKLKAGISKIPQKKKWKGGLGRVKSSVSAITPRAKKKKVDKAESKLKSPNKKDKIGGSSSVDNTISLDTTSIFEDKSGSWIISTEGKSESKQEVGSEKEESRSRSNSEDVVVDETAKQATNSRETTPEQHEQPKQEEQPKDVQDGSADDQPDQSLEEKEGVVKVEEQIEIGMVEVMLKILSNCSTNGMITKP